MLKVALELAQFRQMKWINALVYEQVLSAPWFLGSKFLSNSVRIGLHNKTRVSADLPLVLVVASG
jgi:hypothetical protein